MPQVLIVGGGFGGLNAAKAIAKLNLQITLVDRNNYHLFQPLLYQVATAGLASVDVARPIRSILKRCPNVEVLMAEVRGIDPHENKVLLDQGSIPYDYLVLAPGSHYNYFGHEDWATRAPSLKSIPDALKIRRLVLEAFEMAEMEQEPDKQKALLNFIVVGGGPTGVELAGSIAELAHHTLTDDFRRIDTKSARILLVEAAPRILGPFPETLAEKARDRLTKMGVEVREKTMVEQVNERGAVMNGEFFPAKTILWCAGVLASPLFKTLGVDLDKGGRVPVAPDLSVPQHPNVFVIGDGAQFIEAGHPLPGLAPVAIQQGRHLKKVLASRLKGEKQGPDFHYRDKGELATVGKGYAVAQFGHFKTAGYLGWLLWAFVHILYLVGFQNKALVLMRWAWQYFSFDRGARVITKEVD
jgi:NADH dehydrogenase